MNGSIGQAVIVTGVVSPQDLPFLQVSQSARPGAREFREALYVAAAQDKNFDLKQLDREPLRSAGASRADAQTSKKTLSSTETRDGTSEFSESLGIVGETHETLDSEPREESVNGKGLPTFDRPHQESQTGQAPQNHQAMSASTWRRSCEKCRAGRRLR